MSPGGFVCWLCIFHFPLLIGQFQGWLWDVGDWMSQSGSWNLLCGQWTFQQQRSWRFEAWEESLNLQHSDLMWELCLPLPGCQVPVFSWFSVTLSLLSKSTLFRHTLAALVPLCEVCWVMKNCGVRTAKVRFQAWVFFFFFFFFGESSKVSLFDHKVCLCAADGSIPLPLHSYRRAFEVLFTIVYQYDTNDTEAGAWCCVFIAILTYVLCSIGWNVGAAHIVRHCNHRNSFIFEAHFWLLHPLYFVVHLGHIKHYSWKRQRNVKRQENWSSDIFATWVCGFLFSGRALATNRAAYLSHPAVVVADSTRPALPQPDTICQLWPLTAQGGYSK